MINLTKHGNNANIHVKMLSDYMMRYLGFTDHVSHRWYLCKQIDTGITFNMSIEKDGSDWSIDVLDEDILQPYDYQHLLEENPKHSFALRVKQRVDDYMIQLINVGIISNWSVGDYI